MLSLLSILVSWLLAIVAWLPAGHFVLKKFKADDEENLIQGFILAIILGAAFNSTILGFLSLTIPITAYVASGVALVTVSVFFRSFRTGLSNLVYGFKNWSWLSWAGFAVFAVLAILCSLHTSLNNDSGLYYIQFMNWINQYPVVPGLANLHDRLGFNSHWHLLNAAYDMKTIGLENTNDLNGSLFLITGLGIFNAVSSKNQNGIGAATWAFLALTFFMLPRFITSTAPDLPATLIPIIALIYFAENREKSSLPLLITILAFAATIKVLSALLVVAIIPLIFWQFKKADYGSIAFTVLAGLLISAPWIIRNVIQTGYLVFPMESIDLFAFDWKVPTELAGNARKMVDTHARTGSYNLTNYGKPMSEWFGFWLSVQSKAVLAFFAAALAFAVGLIGDALYKLIRKTDLKEATVNISIAMALMLTLAFWWKSGPNPRFVYAIVFFVFAHGLAVTSTKLGQQKLVRFVPLVALLPLIMICRGMLSEPGPKRSTEFATMEGTSIPVYYPTTTDKCWTQPLPCANMNRTDLVLRGKDLQDGFRNSTFRQP